MLIYIIYMVENPIIIHFICITQFKVLLLLKYLILYKVFNGQIELKLYYFLYNLQNFNKSSIWSPWTFGIVEFIILIWVYLYREKNKMYINYNILVYY